MSCLHGNPIGGCDICDEVDAAFEAGKRSALAEQPAQQQEHHDPIGDAQDKLIAEQAAEQALDKMAENARELGLDYEPVCNKDPQGCWNVRCQLGKKCKNTPAQRTWVGLSQDEFRDFASTLEYGTGGLIRAIEAKLREKNQ